MSGIAGACNLDGRTVEPGIWFDGRLDNRADLLSDLGSEDVTEHSSDSRIVSAAFARWGDQCLSRLNGEFALAAFDSCNQQLVLARDPVGCRPLYYWSNDRQAVFASEIKGVLAHPNVPTRANDDLIADYFARERLPYEDCGETFFLDVRAVLPGRRVLITRDRIVSETFWDFDTAGVVRFASYSDYAEQLRELLLQAIRRRLRSTRPITVAVSGGLDSSIVLCAADRIRKQDGATAELLPVYLGSGGDHAGEEDRALRLLETTTGLPIKRLPFGKTADGSALESAAWHSEWPRLDDGWAAHHPMFTWAHEQGSTTLLSGHWSDQVSFVTGYLSDLFTGFRWREIAEHLREYPRWFIDADPRYFRIRFLRELTFNLTSPQLRRWVRVLSRQRRAAPGATLIAKTVAARADRSRPALARRPCRTAQARGVYQAVRALAHRLQFEADQKLAASCEIEWTTPFLDRDLIGFLMSVPGDIQNRRGVPRALLRDSMRGIVPDAILQRRWRNEDEIVRTRATAYASNAQSLDAAYALGFVRQPSRIDRETIELLGLEFWSRAFFSDRLTPLPCAMESLEPMDTVDPPPKVDAGEKLPYSPPKLTVHGDLRRITAAKQSDRSEAGQPKTFNSGMP
jgi:asparagine synthase (glutamine-hydrolysing)